MYSASMPSTEVNHMKIRRMPLDKALERLEAARANCPGSIYEAHLERHVRLLLARRRSARAFSKNLKA